MTNKNEKIVKEILSDIKLDDISVLNNWNYLMSAYHEIKNFKYHADEQP